MRRELLDGVGPRLHQRIHRRPPGRGRHDRRRHERGRPDGRRGARRDRRRRGDGRGGRRRSGRARGYERQGGPRRRLGGEGHAQLGRGRGRARRRRRDLLGSRPRNRLTGQLEIGEHPDQRQRAQALDREVAPPDHRAELPIRVDGERVPDKLDRLPRPCAPRAHGVPPRQRADRGQPRLQARLRGAQPVEHDPLIAAEILHLLIGRRRVEVPPVEAVGDLRGRRPEAARIGRAEQAPARGPARRDRAEPGRSGRVGRIEHVRQERRAGRRAHAGRVVLHAGAAVRALVDERHPLERARVRRGGRRAIAEDVEPLVHGAPLAEHREPHRRPRDRPPRRRARVPREQHPRARQVRRGLARLLQAAPVARAAEEVLADDLLRRHRPGDALVGELEGRLDDHRHPQPAPDLPQDRSARDRPESDNLERPARRHGGDRISRPGRPPCTR